MNTPQPHHAKPFFAPLTTAYARVALDPLKELQKKIVSFGFRTYIRLHERVPFSHCEVAGRDLPVLVSRLYYETKLLKKVLAGAHVQRSLEVGCGYGRMTPWIAEYSDQHYAVEPDEILLRDAERLNKHVKFTQARAQALPFPDSMFDLCVTWAVLQHVPPSIIGGVVSEIKRVAKPDGTITLREFIGERRSRGFFWERSLDEYRNLMRPWKPTRVVTSTPPTGSRLTLQEFKLPRHDDVNGDFPETINL